MTDLGCPSSKVERLPDRFTLVPATGGQRAVRVEDRVHQRRAVAFSVAGLPTPPNDRFSFSDAGVRYEFVIDGGRVMLVERDGKHSDFSTEFVSHERERAPRSEMPPPFSMVAASGGRVFAKEAGKFSFAFAAMEPADRYFDPVSK